MDNKDTLLKIMQRAYKGKLSREAIPTLPTRQQQVYAAVGYILGHPKTYLTDDLCLKQPYRQALNNLTGISNDEATAASREAGLHKVVAHKTIMLTPPPGIGIKTQSGLSPEDTAEVAKMMRLIDRYPHSVAFAVYLRLKERFEA